MFFRLLFYGCVRHYVYTRKHSCRARERKGNEALSVFIGLSYVEIFDLCVENDNHLLVRDEWRIPQIYLPTQSVGGSLNINQAWRVDEKTQTGSTLLPEEGPRTTLHATK